MDPTSDGGFLNIGTVLSGARPRQDRVMTHDEGFVPDPSFLLPPRRSENTIVPDELLVPRVSVLQKGGGENIKSRIAHNLRNETTRSLLSTFISEGVDPDFIAGDLKARGFTRNTKEAEDYLRQQRADVLFDRFFKRGKSIGL